MKVAITGATGHLGRLVVSKLKEKIPADNIIALVRSSQKAAGLGVEAREANYEKPESLDAALMGVNTLLLISGSEMGKRAAQHHNVINAAKKTCVKWIIYTSMLHADTSTINLAPEHLTTEKELKESGIPFTILRNGWYTENYTNSISGAIASGTLTGSAGDGKISAASREDFAEAAVVVLTTEGQQGKLYELAGDEAFTLSELAAEIFRQTGKDIFYKNMPVDEYANLLISFGLPQDLAQIIAGWDVGISKGDLFEDNKQLSELIGRPTTPVSVVIAEAAKQTS